MDDQERRERLEIIIQYRTTSNERVEANRILSMEKRMELLQQRALQQELDRIATTDLETTVYADYNEQYQSFVLIALLLLVIDFFILMRQNHRLSQMDLFKEKVEK